tara:strand:- start:1742 stop:1921 length:180 start_codon:yes stop_codon:yes gene_type:complete
MEKSRIPRNFYVLFAALARVMTERPRATETKREKSFIVGCDWTDVKAYNDSHSVLKTFA